MTVGKRIDKKRYVKKYVCDFYCLYFTFHRPQEIKMKQKMNASNVCIGFVYSYLVCVYSRKQKMEERTVKSMCVLLDSSPLGFYITQK